MNRRKKLEIPSEAAEEFVRDMKAFFEARGQLAGDEIAANALWKLKQHLPKGTRIGLTRIKELFYAMRDEL